MPFDASKPFTVEEDKPELGGNSYSFKNLPPNLANDTDFLANAARAQYAQDQISNKSTTVDQPKSSGLDLSKPFTVEEPQQEVSKTIPSQQSIKEQVLGILTPNYKEMSYSEAAKQGIGNLPKSTGTVLHGLYTAVRHPLDTAKGVLDLGAGELQRALPESVVSAISSMDFNPEEGRRVNEMAANVNERYAKYATPEGRKELIATDPAGVLLDLSTILSGGASAAGKAGLTATEGALKTAASVTNPLNIAIKPIQIATKVGGKTAALTLGTYTGVGAQAIQDAYNAGKNGSKAFLDNLRQKVPVDDALNMAKDGLEKMRASSSKAYAENKELWAKSDNKLNYDKIDNTMQSSIDSVKSGKLWKIGDDEKKSILEAQKIVDEWKADPSQNNVGGFDALKQRLDAIYPDINQRQARRVIRDIRDSVKQTIVDVSPEYKNAMKDYEIAWNLQNEIEKGLALGSKASKETAINKLKASEKVGGEYKKSLIQKLEEESGVSLRDALTGQQFSRIEPRLGLFTGGLGAAAAYTQNPLLLAPLVAKSPRVVGEASYYAGKASNVGKYAPTAEQLKYPTQLGNLKDLMEGK